MNRLYAESPQEKQIADVTAHLSEATATLRKSGLAAFGDQASAPLGADLGASPAALQRIDAAPVDLDGDKATVRPADSEGPPLTLIRREGVWRLPVAELLKDVESIDVQRSIDAMTQQIRLMKAMSDEVAGGKYKTAIDARQELDKRIIQATMPKNPPPPPADAIHH